MNTTLNVNTDISIQIKTVVLCVMFILFHIIFTILTS